MATALRRCLYIGLGGTGMNALLRTKKMFIENYGEVPPMIGFLGIDTDKGEYDTTVDSKYGKIALLPSEQCSISVDEPKDYYNLQKRRGELTWLPDENASSITTLDKGAGQVRTNGRLAFMYNLPKLNTVIAGALANISNHQIVDNPKYELLKTAGDEIHLIFSICGGTGCGTFLDVAYLIQKLRPNVNLVGYGILPNVFKEMIKGGSAMRNVRPNAYGAIRDIDYLMDLTPASKEVDLGWISEKFSTNDKPFSALNLIDNKNEDGTTYQHIDDITEMVSLSLVSAAGQIGNEAASVADNVKIHIAQGTFDVEDKTAWFSTLGASEIVFKGHDIAKVVALKSTVQLIQKLTNSTESGVDEANSWIDLPTVKIRENGGNKHDDVIDALLSKRPKMMLTQISDNSNPKQDVTAYINTVIPANNTIEETLTSMITRVEGALQIKVEEMLNRGREGGIKLAFDMITNLIYQIEELFKKEMKEEQEHYEKLVAPLAQQIDICCDDLKSYNSRLFKTGATLNNKANDVISAATASVINSLEIKRRIYAIQFYNAIVGTAKTHLDKITSILSIMNSICVECEQDISSIQHSALDSKTVRIDLSSSIVRSVEIEDESIIISEFINSLEVDNLYELTTKEELTSAFKRYCESLADVVKWENKTIDNVLDELDLGELTRIAEVATKKAMPMMKINAKGHTTAGGTPLIDAVQRYYYVCVPNHITSRLNQNNFYRNLCPAGVDISFISTGLDDKVIIYRQEGTFPALAIGSIDPCKEVYENDKSPVSYHFDADIYRQMKIDKHSLEPRVTNIVDEANAIELWVKSFIFKQVKIENGTYRYIDRINGSSLNKYWIDSKEKDRDLAFKVFCSEMDSIKEQYNKTINDIINKDGSEKIDALIADVKENYYEKYSLLGISVEQIQERGFEGICELMEKELDYVDKL